MRILKTAGIALGVLFSTLSAIAQTDIYAIYRSGSGPWNDPFIPIARFGIDSAVPTHVDTVFGISGVALSSSTFLDASQEYWFSGMESAPPMALRLVGLNVGNGQYTVGNTLQETVNEYQYDMQTQILYGLGNYVYSYDSILNIPEYRTRLVRVDFATSSLTEVRKYSHISAVVSGNSTFDSDSSYFYFQGLTTGNQQWLYKVQAGNGAIVDSVNLNMPPNIFFNEWEFDQGTGAFYGLYRDNNNNTISLASLDFSTGQVSVVCLIPNMMGLTPGASDYDHLTGQFIMLGFMNNGDLRFIRVDVASGTVYQSPPINGYVIEFEIDNSRFASNRYGVSSTPENPSAATRLFPNPTTGLTAQIETVQSCTYEVYNLQGQRVLDGALQRGLQTIEAGALTQGVYIVRLSTGEQIRWVIQRN